MDAINVKEVGTPTYQSQNPGKMHACGHDGHMTILLGAMTLLAESKNLMARSGPSSSLPKNLEKGPRP